MGWLFPLVALALAVACGGPSPEPAVLEAARGSIASGDFASASALLEDWLESRPDAPSHERAAVLGLAAHARMHACEFDEALVLFDAAVRATPADPWAHYGRGTALEETGELEGAIVEYDKALALDPDHLRSAQHRGWVQSLLGRQVEALASHERALEILARSTPEELAAWGGDPRVLECELRIARADTLITLGRYAEAEADRERARALGQELRGGR